MSDAPVRYLSASHGVAGGAGLSRFAGLALVAAIFVAAICLRTLYVTTADTSWLITVAEKYLDGKRLYLDIMENNPPAAVFLYVPAVVMAKYLPKYLPWSAEAIVAAQVFIAIAGSMVASGLLLKRSPQAAVLLNAPVAALTLFVLAILPGESFSQREHIATILILPWLALALLRLEDVKPPLALTLAAGIAGGVVFCIKPVFAAAFAAVFLLVLFVRPSLKYVFAPEHVVGGILSVAYVAMTFLAFPEYWRVLYPVLAAVYLPSRGFEFGWQLTALWAILAGMCIMLRPRPIWREAAGILLAASAGFALACIWQAKYWTYHFYPMMALAMIASFVVACSALLAEREAARGVALPFMTAFRCMAPAVLALFVVWRLFPIYWPQQDMRPLADAIRRAAPAPAVLNLTEEIYVGHPAVRMAQGQWAGTLYANWIHRHVNLLDRDVAPGSTLAKGIDMARRFNLEAWRSDFQSQRGNVVLATDATLFWAQKDEELARHLREFVPVSRISLKWLQTEVIVMARRTPLAD